LIEAAGEVLCLAAITKAITVYEPDFQPLRLVTSGEGVIRLLVPYR
jgi:hypothetical protein